MFVIRLQNSELGMFPAKEAWIGRDWTQVAKVNNNDHVAHQFIDLPGGP